jgi:hypothetical protein
MNVNFLWRHHNVHIANESISSTRYNMGTVYLQTPLPVQTSAAELARRSSRLCCKGSSKMIPVHYYHHLLYKYILGNKFSNIFQIFYV